MNLNKLKRETKIFLLAALAVFLFVAIYTVIKNNPDAFAPQISDKTLTKSDAQEIARNIWSAYKNEGAPEGEEDSLSDDLPAEKPSGQIIFSGQTNANGRKPQQIFSIDISSTSSEPTVYSTTQDIALLPEFLDSSNPEDYFLVTYSEFSQENDSDSLSIHRFDKEEDTTQAFKNGVGNFERNLAWSPNTKVLAYSSLKEESALGYPDLLPMENWEIIVFKPENDERVVTIKDAVQPKWSPDGTKMLYFKSDGLHMYDFSQEKGRRVHKIEDGTSLITTSMFDVSPDGKYLVWTTAMSGVISIFEINSWELSDIKLQSLGKISSEDTQYFWPQFSPDSQFYVVQGIDTPDPLTLDRDNPRFEIRPTLGRQVVSSYPLDRFNFNAMFTDDWIAANEDTATTAE